MNLPMIRYVLGWVLAIEGAFMALPCLVAAIYGEAAGWWFVPVALAALLAGGLMARRKPADMTIYVREGCVATALSWLALSLVGCLPFWLSGEIPYFLDALFETVSGFTTTGASILTDVEALSRCMLFWRSFTHWLGGMGVLVFLLMVLQMPGGSRMNLMRAESPGPSVGKLKPKVRQTARILYLIYLGMTVLEVALLLAGGMPLFDALCTSFGSAGTGGFGIYNASLAGYSPYIQWVTTLFILLFGTNFTFYYLLLLRRWRQALGMEEVRLYFLIVAGSVAVIVWQLSATGESFGKILRDAAFQVASIITTTGFSTVNFDLWPQTSRSILVVLMFIGACAGSTGGGIKVSRIGILCKTMFKELGSYVLPKRVRKVEMDGKPLPHEVVRGVNVFLVSYLLVFTLSVLLVSLDGADMVTNFTAVAATFNNIGPGLELVGPTGNFAHFSSFAKLVLSFDMLAGRLELFPVLLLFYPGTWKGALRRARRQTAA